MRSEKQIAASRLNGHKSKGPRKLHHPDGPEQDAVNENSAYRALAEVVVHPNESRRGFICLCLFLRQHIQPVHALEHLIVGRIAAAHWRQIRHWRREREAAAHLGAVPEEHSPVPIQANAGLTGVHHELAARHEHRLDLAFFRAVANLYRVRIWEKRISGQSGSKLLKRMRRIEKLKPGNHPGRTQPDPT